MRNNLVYSAYNNMLKCLEHVAPVSPPPWVGGGESDGVRHTICGPGWLWGGGGGELSSTHVRIDAPLTLSLRGVGVAVPFSGAGGGGDSLTLPLTLALTCNICR